MLVPVDCCGSDHGTLTAHLCIVDGLVQQRDSHIVSIVNDVPTQNQVQRQLHSKPAPGQQGSCTVPDHAHQLVTMWPDLSQMKPEPCPTGSFWESMDMKAPR